MSEAIPLTAGQRATNYLLQFADRNPDMNVAKYSMTPKQRRRIKKKARQADARARADIAALTESWIDTYTVELSEFEAEVTAENDYRLHLEAHTRDDLRKKAAELGISGRGAMNKAQLVDAILRFEEEAGT